MRHHNSVYLPDYRLDPPESVYDTLTECPECDGDGAICTDTDDGGTPYYELCECCQGKKWLDEDGQPFDPEANQEQYE